jgi:hypothetical protein
MFVFFLPISFLKSLSIPRQSSWPDDRQREKHFFQTPTLVTSPAVSSDPINRWELVIGSFFVWPNSQIQLFGKMDQKVITQVNYMIFIHLLFYFLLGIHTALPNVKGAKRTPRILNLDVEDRCHEEDHKWTMEDGSEN